MQQYVICAEKNHTNLAKNKYFCKVIDHCKYRDVTYSICNLRFNVSYEIPVIFHNFQTMNIILL